MLSWLFQMVYRTHFQIACLLEVILVVLAMRLDPGILSGEAQIPGTRLLCANAACSVSAK